MKKIIINILLMILVISSIGFISAIPNPAPVYCSNMGYTYNETSCIFSDGDSCEVWSFYNGNCGKEHIKNLSCVEKGGSVSPGYECCNGLSSIGVKTSIGSDEVCNAIAGAWNICSPCGNGVCDSETENKCNCPKDCPEDRNSNNTCGDGICTPEEKAVLCVDPGIYPNGTLMSGGGCKQVCPKDCNSSIKCSEGSTKKYTCPDGLKVDWCSCSNGNWACIESPEIKCKKEIDAYLNQKFELKMQQTAIIRDYKDMKVKYIASSACSCPICEAGVSCPCPPCKLEIKLQASIPSGDIGTATEFSLSVGEKKKVFDVSVSLIDLSKGVAVLLVSKENCPVGCTCTENYISCPACQEGYVYNPKTQKCESLVYNCPEGCVCNENVTSCPNNITLQKKGYRHAYWECYNGKEWKSEGNNCLSAELWKKKAINFCNSECNKEKCGVNSFSISEECYSEDRNSICNPGEDIQKCCLKWADKNNVITPACVGSWSIEDDKCSYSCKEETEISAGSLFCKNSCPLDSKCYPFGYRKSGKYCTDNGVFEPQIKAGETCENNFECSSNVCVSGECISQGLIKKIINWFKKMFG